MTSLEIERGKAGPAGTNGILLREDCDGVARLVLNRPRARNSLSSEMLTALEDALAEIRADQNVRVVVVAANGPAYCAGHDLKEMNARREDPDHGRAFYREMMELCARVMTAIVYLPKPVIAEVQGPASAAGCQLVASCDLAVASEQARFATPGVDIGLFCSTPMVALSRNAARKHAMEMLLFGELIEAERAREIGLVNAVVPHDRLVETARDWAMRIASKSMLTVAIGKEAFYRQAEMNLEDAYRYAAEVMVENMMARDSQEGIEAFLERREPEWEDR